jgi:pimeloyl-ACP methyl ester carboxylesterase
VSRSTTSRDREPGRLIALGTHRLHLLEAGHGSPAVVFDAALGGSFLSWSHIHPYVSRLTRACAYDRAGFGWSDPGPLPRTAGRVADELHALLHAAGVPPPYLLVGHSFGGLVVRLFAARHREDVAGLILLEPAIPADWIDPSAEKLAQIQRGKRLCAIGSHAARLGFARVVAALVRTGALTPARALVAVVSRGGLRREDEGILAPIWKLPPDVRRRLASFWAQPKFFAALGSQIEHIRESAAEVERESPLAYGDLPLTVITAERAEPSRLEADAALSRTSTQGRHVLAPDSGHWVPLDAPRVVVDAIAAMVDHIRSR